MKGRLLSYEEVIRLPHGTRVYVESNYSIQENAIINQESELIGNYNNWGINNCIWQFNNLDTNMIEYNIKIYEWIEDTQPKTYKGSEIIHMIEKGLLKDDDIIINKEKIEISIEDMKDNFTIYDFLQCDKYIIKQKPVDFMTAVNSGKNIRPESLSQEKKFHPYTYWLGYMVSSLAYNESPLDLINGLWEIEQ